MLKMEKTYKDVVTDKVQAPSRGGFVIWGAAAFFYLYEVILRVSPSVMTTELMEHFKISATNLGWLSTSYYLSYFIFQIPCGLLSDKYGPRRVISVSALLCAVGTLIFCTQDHLYIAMFGRFLIGAGSACAFIGCLKLATDWFAPGQFPLIAGLTNMMGTLGATFAGRPLAKLVNTIGWQQSCFYLSMIGFLVSFIIWAVIRDKKTDKPMPFSKQNLYALLKSKNIWLMGTIAGFLYLPITAFAELWGVPYLMEAFSINNEIASQATVMIFVGTAIGSPIFAYIAHLLKSYKRAMIFGAISSSLLFVGVSMAGYFSYSSIFIMLFFIGFMTGGEVLAFTIVKNATEKTQNGTAMGMTNALVSFIGLFFQPFLGGILDYLWKGTLSPTGIRIYDIETYRQAIYSLPIVLLISVLLLMFVKDKQNLKAQN